MSNFSHNNNFVQQDPKTFDKNKFTIILFYKYTNLDNPDRVMLQQQAWCDELNLKGRTIIANEGINSTLEGKTADIEEYITRMSKIKEFQDIHWKKSEGTGTTFLKLSIKVRDEIVSTRLDSKEDIGPHKKLTGKYITPKELHALIRSNEEFFIVDMRNDYEYQVGYFDKSILLHRLTNFRHLPEAIKDIEHLKDKQIITVCTGGVRCEKASGFLLTQGFQNVSQLAGGIVSYMEEYPNEDFLGKLYVFDKRLIIGFNTNSNDHTIVGKCRICSKTSENIVDYYDPIIGIRKHGIVCQECIVTKKIRTDSLNIVNSEFLVHH